MYKGGIRHKTAASKKVKGDLAMFLLRISVL